MSRSTEAATAGVRRRHDEPPELRSSSGGIQAVSTCARAPEQALYFTQKTLMQGNGDQLHPGPDPWRTRCSLTLPSKHPLWIESGYDEMHAPGSYMWFLRHAVQPGSCGI